MDASVFIATVSGFGIGILSGLLGIGGGMLMVPLMHTGFGIPAAVSTASSLATIVPTSFSGMMTHLKQQTCKFDLGIAAGAGGLCFSSLGAWCADKSASLVIIATMCVVIVFSSTSMLTKMYCLRRGKTKVSPLANKPVWIKRLNCAAIGIIGGFLAGFVGVGGGFIFIPFFTSALGLSIKQASGTSLVAVMILAIPGVATQALLGNVSWHMVIALSLGAIPGAFIGARLVTRVSEHALRLCFIIFLLVVAIIMLASELHLF